MKQAKIESIIIFSILILYFIVSKIFFINLGTTYTMIINPIFWIVLVIILKMHIKKFYLSKKLKKEILDYTLIAVLIYIIIYLFSGLFVSFGKNPNSQTLKGVLINFWITGSVIFCREYIRFLIINNVFENQKKVISIFLVIIFSLLEIINIDILGNGGYYIFKQIISVILPTIVKNILFTYIAYCKYYWPSILYELLIYLVLWTSPILPNLKWILIAVIDIAVPTGLYLYIRYRKNKSDYYKSKEAQSDSDPKSMIALMILVIIGIWFALGVFPIKPIAIATGSMYPNINIGDVVILKKCSINDIKSGDVIEYKSNGKSIVHRVIDVNQKNGEFFIITKGDNNEHNDSLVNEEQLVGKALFKLKYIGYPAIWLTNARTEENL